MYTHTHTHTHTHTLVGQDINIQLIQSTGRESKTSFKETVLPGLCDLELGDFKKAASVEQF